MISGLLQGSAGWGDACILVPWALYQAYGRKEILEENYGMMQGWMDYCKKRAEKTRLHNLKNPYHKYLVDQGFHFGEWCQPDVDNTEAISAQADALGFNILFGSSPDKLYHSCMVFEGGEKRVGALIAGREYYVRADAFNENGITQGQCIKLQ